MKSLENQRVLILDHGLFCFLAPKLAETFAEVYYYVPATGDGFPSADRRRIGTGMDGVIRVDDWLSLVNEVDTIICPDVYFRSEVNYLRSIGKAVWGAGDAEALELERWGTKQLMSKLGMPVIEGELIKGMKALRRYLADREDVWIKSASARRGAGRGDVETFHFKNMALAEPELERIAEVLGPFREEAEFIVEESVDGCEVGYDGFCVDGRFSEVAFYGYEIKDAGFVGRVVPFMELPDPIHIPTTTLAVAMRRLRCRGFYSNEVRITEDGTAYLIDPCLRMGSPPSEVYIELFSNWPEVITEGARGRVVDLLPEFAYAAQIVLKSQWVEERYLPVSFPEGSRYIKLHNACKSGDQWYVAKQKFPEFGAAIGVGDTLKEAMDMARRNAERVDALELKWDKSVFDEAEKCIEAGREVGVDWE